MRLIWERLPYIWIIPNVLVNSLFINKHKVGIQYLHSGLELEEEIVIAGGNVVLTTIPRKAFLFSMKN